VRSRGLVGWLFIPKTNGCRIWEEVHAEEAGANLRSGIVERLAGSR
jgi:hypothetical protein